MAKTHRQHERYSPVKVAALKPRSKELNSCLRNKANAAGRHGSPIKEEPDDSFYTDEDEGKDDLGLDDYEE